MSDDLVVLKEEGKRLVETLHGFGYREVIRIEFSGSGDSGGIDSVTGIPKKDQLYQQVHDWAEEFTSALDVDWYNNDGGQGYIELDPAKKTVEYQVETNYMESQVADQGTF